MPTCLLIRHGRTTANTQGILAGWSQGVGLDDTGRRQGAELGERLRGVRLSVVVSSPLQRCVETALIVVGESDVAVETDDRVGECRYGAWTGRSLKDLAKESLWRTVQDQPSAARFPDGETFTGESIGEMQARALQAVREIDARVGAEHGPHALWALVSHGDVIKSILADAAGAHLDHFQRLMVGPGSLSVVTYTDRRPFLVRLNDGGADLSFLASTPHESPSADPGEGGASAGDAQVGGGAGSAGTEFTN